MEGAHDVNYTWSQNSTN